MSRFATIVADPPWTPTEGRRADYSRCKARPQRHYPTMDVEQIEALEVPAADSAHLWLWALSQHLDWGWRVARAWGFEPVTTLTWCKPGMGAGRFQSNTEHVLVCRRGPRSAAPFGATGGTYFNWPRGAHSAKPDAFYDLVERVSPGPYAELFARRARFGWDYPIGNQSLGGQEIAA